MTDAAFCENCGTDRDQYGSPDRRLFHRCASCRLEVCPDCWNRGRDLCLNCAPFSIGLMTPGRAPVAAGAPAPLVAAVPAQASGWTLVAPDDSPGLPAAVAPAAVPAASVFETVAASRIRLGGMLAAIRGRGIAGLGTVAGSLGQPVRMATHAVLLLCLTTLGLLVTWQLVSFAGTALPSSTPPGAALGAGASATPSGDPTVGTTPVPLGGATGGGVPTDHDRGQGGGTGGDGSHGGAGPTPPATPQPTATAGGTPTDSPTATPTPMPTPTTTPAPTPTDTPTAAPTDTPPPPTDTPPPPPTDTPAPPPTETPGP